MLYSLALLASLNAEMKARDMTQQELARRAKISNSFLSAILAGDANPSLQVLAGLAAAFDVPLPRLFESSQTRPTGAAEPHSQFLPGRGGSEHLPVGYRRVNCILPESRAAIVDEWAVIAKKAIVRDQTAGPKPALPQSGSKPSQHER